MTTHKPLFFTLFGAALLFLLPSKAAQADPPATPNLVQLVYSLQAQVTALQTQVNELQAQSAVLAAIAPYVSLETVNGHPTIRFSGANVQVVNGEGTTASANGTGNLIVGYDEPNTTLNVYCTIGTNPTTRTPVVDPTTCADAGGSWLDTGFKTGSHYLVLGSGNNYSRWGGLIAGQQNTSNYDYASISGGIWNTASGPHSSVSGGFQNTASGFRSSVSGGDHNKASSSNSSVSGGFDNTASGDSSSVSGGQANTASGAPSSVSGGFANVASGGYSSISGGAENTASGTPVKQYSSVSGGNANTASGHLSSISGGQGNTASGAYSSILGGNSQNATTDYQTIP